MKYIHIVQFHLMSGGGVGSVITYLCESMCKQTNEVYVISLFRHDGINFTEAEEWAKTKGIHVLLMQENKRDGWFKVITRLRKTIIDLSHNDNCCLYLHLKWGVLAGIASSLGLKRVRRVEVYHSGYLNYKIQAALCKFFIHKHIAVSKESKQQLIDWFHISPNKIEVVYNGVDIQYIRRCGTSDIPKDSILKLLSVGRLTRQKGLLTAIEAFSSLKEKGGLDNCTYTIVGRGELLEQAKSISRGHVVFTGLIPREDVYKRISQCDIVFFPSVWEGNSIFLLEVLALGKPLIVSDIPSSREVLGFNPLSKSESCRLDYFGVIVRAEDTESCKNALIQIESSRDFLSKMASKVRVLADDFSIEKQVARYMEIADDVFTS